MSSQAHRVVIIGGGFGGLYAAQHLKNAPVEITLIDKRNFHLFQPLLYQVATGTISPADISSPLRAILSQQKNTKVLLDEAIDVDCDRQIVKLRAGEIPYDTLIVAAGASHHYFGNDRWQVYAPGLKTIEDALEIRRRIFMAFEAAEKEADIEAQRAWLTFVIVGAGPTGVELAGAIAELSRTVLQQDFRNIDTATAQILLVEGADRVLPPYPEPLSRETQTELERLGVTVLTGAMVTEVSEGMVVVRRGEALECLRAQTILWGAGVKASRLGKVLAERSGAELDRAGRVVVEPDLTLRDRPNVFVIGDLAHFAHQADGRPLPGIAPVAMQEGRYVANLLRSRLRGKAASEPFVYRDAGRLAAVGHNWAVVDLGFMRFSGFLGWIVWAIAHIYYLIEFDNKLVVMVQWGWNYLTRGRGARLITGEEALLRVDVERDGGYSLPEDGASETKNRSQTPQP